MGEGGGSYFRGDAFISGKTKIGNRFDTTNKFRCFKAYIPEYVQDGAHLIPGPYLELNDMFLNGI